MIEEYAFGKIKINGKDYTKDIELRWNGEVLNWWRLTGHRFQLPDIERAINQEPELIIMDTGESGMATVDNEVKEVLNQKDIKFIMEKTDIAVKVFNQALQEKKKAIGLFNLTC